MSYVLYIASQLVKQSKIIKNTNGYVVFYTMPKKELLQITDYLLTVTHALQKIITSLPPEQKKALYKELQKVQRA